MERGGFQGYRKLPNNTISPGGGVGLKVRVGEDHNLHHSNNNNVNVVVGDDNECTVREQDRFMPIANVIRIMRKILPAHAKISDDAKETIQECVSEYISFITGEANERCQREQRKTITAEDVLWAMSKLGFDDYIEPLTMYLHRYREMEGDRASIRGEPLGLGLGLTKRSPLDGYGPFVPVTPGPAPPPVPPFHHHHHHHIPNGYFMGHGAPQAHVGYNVRDHGSPPPPPPGAPHHDPNGHYK